MLRRLTSTLLALLVLLSSVSDAGLVVQSGPKYFAPVLEAGSVSFTGGASTANSPSVRIARTGAMDIGASGEFTVEFWLTANANDADNDDNGFTEGANYGGTITNVNLIWDADSENTRGFILAINDGVFCMGVNNAGGSRTICGGPDLRDGLPHHVAAQFRVSDGLMEIFVDGNEVDTIDGPNGAVGYDGDAPTTDSFHYIAKEKLNLTFGYAGLVSATRVSDARRYTGTTYTEPTAMWTDDASTVGLYDLTEQAGTVMGDSSGNGFDGELVGSPVPSWSTANPF